MASVVQDTSLVAEPSTSPVPPLQNGDRLTAEEFERRYDAMPGLKKAELINGVVYLGAAESLNGECCMSSPVSQVYHSGRHFDLITWLGFYRTSTPGVEGGDSGSLRLSMGENEPQPDAFLRILPECGGQSRTSPDGFVLGAPEHISEVAASSVSYDLHAKLDAYQRNGVLEYVVWRVYDREIDWFVLVGDRYEKALLDPDGLYRSKVFPGLWLDPAALIRGGMQAVFQAVQRGVATPEHAAFVARLQQAATGK